MDKLRSNGADFSALKEFRHPAVLIEGDSSVVPCAGKREIFLITLAPFRDHGRPAYIASTIKSRSAFREAASSLTEEESQRLNSLLSHTMEGLLNEGTIRNSSIVLRSSQNRPDIYVITSGDTFRDSSLRLYCHVGEYEDAKVLYQDARATRKGAERVQRVLVKQGGYQVPSSWRT